MITKFNFYLKEPSADTETLIYMFCSFAGQRLKYSTREKIHPYYWNDKTQSAKKNFAGYYTLNGYLDKVKQIAQDLIREAISADKPLTVETLRDSLNNRLQGAAKQNEQPINLLNTYMQVNKVLLAPNTLKKYNTLRNHLIDFQSRYKFKITFDSINTIRFDEHYRAYLLNDLNHLNTSVAKDIITLKVFLNWCVRCGYSTNTEYKKFKAKEPETDLIALDEAELMQLYNFDFSENLHLEQVRDVFCFQCFSGLRFSDVKKLTRENIKGDIISIFVQKTGKYLKVPLNDYSLELMQKYDFKLPVITNQKTNEQIKKICKIAGIDTMVMTTKFKGVEVIREIKPKFELIVTHTGRRTFITLSLERGMAPELIMEITGQKTYREFRKYLKLTEKVVTTAMTNVWSKEPNLKVV
jgi:integrase